MNILVSKKDANIPLYLSLACEELRVFGVFEEVIVFSVYALTFRCSKLELICKLFAI